MAFQPCSTCRGMLGRKEKSKMQINVFLKKNSKEQAEIIRKEWYPTTTSNQTLDAFIFNDCITRFLRETRRFA